MNTAYEIERLIRFGLAQGLIEELDAFVARNTLLDLFGLTEPYAGPADNTPLPERPTEILNALLDAAGEAFLFDAQIHALRVNFETRIML